MVITLKVIEAIKANEVLERIMEQSTEYPINVAFKLYKVRKALVDLEEFVYKRLELIFGFGSEPKNLNEAEAQVYNAVMSSDVEIDNQNLKITDLSQSNTVHIPLNSIGNLLKLLPETEELYKINEKNLSTNPS